MGMARDTATLMVGQYFKKRRELVEIFLVSGSGLGISAMSSWVRWVTREIGWRLGLQVRPVVMTIMTGMAPKSGDRDDDSWGSR